MYLRPRCSIGNGSAKKRDESGVNQRALARWLELRFAGAEDVMPIDHCSFRPRVVARPLRIDAQFFNPNSTSSGPRGLRGCPLVCAS